MHNNILHDIKDRINISVPIDTNIYMKLNQIAKDNNKLLEDIITYYIENELTKIFETNHSTVNNNIKDYVVITMDNQKYKIIQYKNNSIEVVNITKSIKEKPVKSILKTFNTLLDEDDKIVSFDKYNTHKVGKLIISKLKSIKYHDIKSIDND